MSTPAAPGNRPAVSPPSPPPSPTEPTAAGPAATGVLTAATVAAADHHPGAASFEFVPHQPYVPADDPMAIARQNLGILSRRRTIREFSNRPVPRELVEMLIATAGTAPSGANKQPWRFIAVQDAELKREIRVAAEAEEREFYERRASERWLQDLAPLGTDARKPFLEVAPWLIVVFKLTRTDDGQQVYYTDESVGIAVGMFLAAAHMVGLATLTHTPSPMKFLARLLRRPEHERPFLLIPLGYPAPDARVPCIRRKPLEQILVFDRGASASPTAGESDASAPASK